MDNQEKNINEIRDLLRKKLADQTPADNGWNVPSNRVWAGLSEELQAEKKEEKSLWQRYTFLLLALVLIAVLSVQECTHRYQVSELQSEVEELRSSVSELQLIGEEWQEEHLHDHANDADRAATLRSPGENTADKFGEAGFKSALTNLSDINSTPVVPADPSEKQSARLADTGGNRRAAEPAEPLNGNPDPAFAASSLPFVKNDAAGEGVSNQQNPFSEKLPAPNGLPVPALSLIPFTNISPLPNHSLNEPVLPFSAKDKIGFSVGLYSGVALTGNTLSGNAPDVIADQQSLPAFRTGVGVEAALTRRLSLEVGLLFGTSNVETDYQLMVPFTHNGEFQHDDGNYDNHYNHSLPSSLGDYPAELVLTRESSAMVNEGELMNLDLSIHQRISFLSVPVSLRYAVDLAPSGNWQLGIKGGIVANHPFRISSEVSSLISHHGAIHQRHTSIGDPAIEDLEKITLDYAAGLDVRYRWSRRWSLSFETAYQRGLTPVYKNESVKSYLHAWHTGVGLRMSF